MKTIIPNDKNYLYELLKRKYHTSEVVRAQIAGIKEKTRGDVVKESLKSYTVKFRGQAIDSSFEKTL
ncbi:MAG: small soluble cyt c, partial [Candidatus Brocadiaceae bacterium]|nr:small soluble cyt c [Candidatus Brocadiaceae bacterium]